MLKRLLRSNMEKSLLLKRENALLGFSSLEKKYAGKLLARPEYLQKKDLFEQELLTVDLALACVRADKEIEKLLSKGQEIEGTKRSQEMREAFRKRAGQIEGFLRKNPSFPHGPLDLAQMRQIHSGFVELEHEVRAIFANEARAKMHQAKVMHQLETALFRQDLREIHDKHALALADEFVIDVPSQHSPHKLAHPKKEAKSKKAKK